MLGEARVGQEQEQEQGQGQGRAVVVLRQQAGPTRLQLLQGEALEAALPLLPLLQPTLLRAQTSTPAVCCPLR